MEICSLVMNAAETGVDISQRALLRRIRDIALGGAGPVKAESLEAIQSESAGFLGPDSLAQLQALAEIMVPEAANRCGGVAAVSDFVDRVLLQWACQNHRLAWRKLLTAVDEVSLEKYQRLFLALDGQKRTAVVVTLNSNMTDIGDSWYGECKELLWLSFRSVNIPANHRRSKQH